MYARANLLTADPAKIDDGIRHMQALMPKVEALPGNRGVAVSIDRETGRGTIVSFWEDEEALHSTEDTVSPFRDGANAAFGGQMIPHALEIVELHVRQEPKPGCWNRLTTIEADPSELDKTIEMFRASTIPALDAMDGFCTAALSVDRNAGRGVAVTVWRDRAALEASRERASGLRQEVTDKAHGSVASVEEQEIVLASLRLP